MIEINLWEIPLILAWRDAVTGRTKQAASLFSTLEIIGTSDSMSCTTDPRTGERT